MRLGEQRDHRHALALEEALDLREMTEARNRRPPATGLLLTPSDRRQLGEEHLVDVDRQVGLELPGKEVELRRAALHQEDLDGLANGDGADPGQAQNTHRQVVDGHPEGRRPDHRIAQEALAEVRDGTGGWRRSHEHALPTPRLDVPTPLQIVDDAGDRVRVDAEEAGQLPDAGQRLLGRNAAGLDDVTELLHQLTPDRDRTVLVDLEVARFHNCIAILVH